MILIPGSFFGSSRSHKDVFSLLEKQLVIWVLDCLAFYVPLIAQSVSWENIDILCDSGSKIFMQENAYALLSKVMEAKGSYIQEGHHHPSKEQVAKRAGISVDKLENLVSTTRTPLSLQQPVWADQGTTFQVVLPHVSVCF